MNEIKGYQPPPPPEYTNEQKISICGFVFAALDSALHQAKTSKSLFSLSPDIISAFPLEPLSETRKNNPEALLRATYPIGETHHFIIESGKVTMSIKGTLPDLKKGNFTCEEIWVEGYGSLFLSMTKRNSTIEISFHDSDNQKLVEDVFLELTGEKQEEEALQMTEDKKTSLSDSYRELDELLQRNMDTDRSFITSGRIMSPEEGKRYIQILNDIEESAAPLQIGEFRLEYYVKRNSMYKNDSNPEGKFLVEIKRSSSEHLEKRYVPVPLIEKKSLRLVGWSVAIAAYFYTTDETPQCRNERIQFSNERAFLDQYENELKPMMPERSQEFKLLHALISYIGSSPEDRDVHFGKVQGLLGSLTDDFVQRQASEAIEEIREIVQYGKDDKAFQSLVNGIEKDIYYSQENPSKTLSADEEELNKFLSKYFARKIYEKKSQEDVLREKIRSQKIYVFFGNLNTFLKYFIFRDGNKRMVR